MSRIKAVLFDFDGTLADTNGVIIASWHHVYDSFGLPYPPLADIIKTFGENLFESMERAFPEHSSEETVGIYRDYMKTCFKDVVRMFDGTEELVRRLRDCGYKLGVVTSRHWYTIKENGYDFPVAELFDTIVSGEDETASKPDPEPCLLAARRLGVRPEETIMVGDSSLDILCGKNAGARTALVGWSMAFPPERAVGEYKPDCILHKASDLLSVLDEMNKDA